MTGFGDRRAGALSIRFVFVEDAWSAAIEATRLDDELADLSSRLDHAYETLEQQKAHEQEKAEAVESYQHTTRRQRALIAVLLALFLLTLVLLLLNL